MYQPAIKIDDLSVIHQNEPDAEDEDGCEIVNTTQSMHFESRVGQGGYHYPACPFRERVNYHCQICERLRRICSGQGRFEGEATQHVRFDERLRSQSNYAVKSMFES